MSQIPQLDRLKIQLQDIKLATNNFSDNNFIGKGGFGKVYKGQLPHSTSSDETSTTVAVKRLDKMYGQGQREFLTKIIMLASYTHDNLVSLVGFSDEGDEKILVFKHEVNGSLDNHIASNELTWERRLRLCLGVARGLDFLHRGLGMGLRVLHRDIKSSNILLDGNWEAKISDFGLSKFGPKNQKFTFLVTNNDVGTWGYVDPQYADTGIFSKKSDVYSFGVVMFEVLCGRLAYSAQYDDVRSNFLYILAKLRYEEGKLDEIILPNLREQMNPESLAIFSKIAYKCLNEDRKNRPTMELIVEELTISLELQTGCIKRTELWGSSTGGAPWGLRLDNNQKLKKITIDHKDWLYSIGFTTQDFSGLSISSHHGGAGPTDDRSGSQISEINFDANEEITGIHGTVGVTTGYYYGYIVISSLCLMTNKKTYGPFGKETGTPFSVPCDVASFAGFYGRAGFYLDGLGCYLKATI